MATVTKRKDRDGKGYYFYVQVKYKDPSTGKFKTKGKCYRPTVGMSERVAKRNAVELGIELEKEKENNTLETETLGNTKLSTYMDEWYAKNEQHYSPSMYYKLRGFLNDIAENLGHLRLNELNQRNIQAYFDKIDARKRIIVVANAKPGLRKKVYSHGYTYRMIEKKFSVRMESFTNACKGKNMSIEWAENFCNMVNIPFDELWEKNERTVEYGSSTLHEYKKTLRIVLASAVREGYIEVNYATSEFIKFPKRTSKRIPTMDDKQAMQFYQTLLTYDDIRIKTSLMTFLLSGFRRGEVAGLTWDNISFTDKSIKVEKTVNYIPTLGLYVKEPKTENAKRKIAVPSMLLNQLKEYKIWQDSVRGDFLPEYRDTNFVFTQPNGSLFSPDLFRHWLQKVLDKAGLPKFTLHSLRHSNLTLQIIAGVPIAVVSKRAGHYKPSVTSDYYFEYTQTSDEMAANVLEKLFTTNDEDNAKKPLEGTLAIDSDISIDDYRKAKEEAKRLGFESYDEYLDYLEFMKAKKTHKNI